MRKILDFILGLTKEPKDINDLFYLMYLYPLNNDENYEGITGRSRKYFIKVGKSYAEQIWEIKNKKVHKSNLELLSYFKEEYPRLIPFEFTTNDLGHGELLDSGFLNFVCEEHKGE